MAAKRFSHGFTLIELILGIVLISITMVIVISFIAPQAEQSARPLIEVKASKLGQSLMNEILSKSYDENSERSAPFRRCDETTGCSATLGPEEALVALYDDVDDYNGTVVTNLGGDYQGFGYSVSVAYDADYDDSTADASNRTIAKRIDLTVTAPSGEVFRFQAYRGNF